MVGFCKKGGIGKNALNGTKCSGGFSLNVVSRSEGLEGKWREGKKFGASRKRLALVVFVAAIRLEETLSGGTKPNETYVGVIDLRFIIPLTFCFIFSIQPHSSNDRRAK